jgi:cytochrome d ubiquinol oxidase subunit I
MGMIQYDMKEGLLTRDAVSATITGGQVLSSIIMFSLIYVLLFWIWVFVLNDKIQKGPKPVLVGGKPGGWLEATAGRTLHEESLSEAKDRPEPAAQN